MQDSIAIYYYKNTVINIGNVFAITITVIVSISIRHILLACNAKLRLYM